MLTYDLFAASWPMQTQNEFGIADKLNRETTYVVSSRLKEAAWQNTTNLAGNVVAEITMLKVQPGAYLRLAGSAILTQSLMQAGLADEFRLLAHPVVRGSENDCLTKASSTRPCSASKSSPSVQASSSCATGPSRRRWVPAMD